METHRGEKYDPASVGSPDYIHLASQEISTKPKESDELEEKEKEEKRKREQQEIQGKGEKLDGETVVEGKSKETSKKKQEEDDNLTWKLITHVIGGLISKALRVPVGIGELIGAAEVAPDATKAVIKGKRTQIRKAYDDWREYGDTDDPRYTDIDWEQYERNYDDEEEMIDAIIRDMISGGLKKRK